MDVVVVLPCVPATPTPNCMRINSPSIAERGMAGMRSRSASAVSGLSRRATAEEYTTTSVSRTFSAACPSCTTAPSEASRSVASDRCRSEPVTS